MDCRNVLEVGLKGQSEGTDGGNGLVGQVGDMDWMDGL
jgi:hypothetical protein